MALRSARYAANQTIDATQFAEFERKLEVLYGMTVQKRRKQMEKVTNFALFPTKKKMIQLAPKGKTGSLKKSITLNTAKATGYGSRVGSRTGPMIRGKSKRRVHHAHLVELGTKKKMKRIGAGKKPFTFYSFKAGRVLRRDKINHGSRARPFVEPSYKATKHKYAPRIKVKMKRILAKLAEEMKTK